MDNSAQCPIWSDWNSWECISGLWKVLLCEILEKSSARINVSHARCQWGTPGLVAFLVAQQNIWPSLKYIIMTDVIAVRMYSQPIYPLRYLTLVAALLFHCHLWFYRKHEWSDLSHTQSYVVTAVVKWLCCTSNASFTFRIQLWFKKI